MSRTTGSLLPIRTRTTIALCVLALSFAATAYAEKDKAQPPVAEAHVELVNYVDALIRKATRAKLWEDAAWLRLGRWRKSSCGGYESEVDGPAFFLAPEGKHSPKKELIATIKGIFAADTESNRAVNERTAGKINLLTPKPTEEEASKPEVKIPKPSPHALCRFPARFGWLNEELQFDLKRLQVNRCPGLERFIGRVKADSVTLVFSAYYLNTPASMFGHTFLRLNQKPRGKITKKRQELLDYGIDFSADVDTGNVVLYAFKGLSGLFPGTFKALPYYYKVREYNDFESRDIWEYDLNLPQKSVTRLVMHLWEMGRTYFDYFYITENCSYHILGLLEAAAPHLDLFKHVGYAAVPADTVKALYENPGLVSGHRYRPSIRSQFKERTTSMSREDRSRVGALVLNPDEQTPLPQDQERTVDVLDAALDLVDMKFGREIVKRTDDKAAKLKQSLLQRRADILSPSKPLKKQTPKALDPANGHGSMRLGLGGDGTRQESITSLDFRLALHDLADPSAGYPALAEMAFLPGELQFRIGNGKTKVQLDNLSLVRIATYSPLTMFDYSVSWKLDVGAVTLRDNGCDECLAGRIVFGTGGTVGFFDDRLALFATLDTQFAVAPDIDGISSSPIRLGFGPAGGLRAQFLPRLVALATGNWIWLPGQGPTSTWEVIGKLRYGITQNFALSAEVQGGPRYTSSQIKALFYF